MSTFTFPASLEQNQETFFVIRTKKVIPKKDLESISSQSKLKTTDASEYYLPMPTGGNSDSISNNFDLVDTSIAQLDFMQLAAKSIGEAAEQNGLGGTIRSASGVTTNTNSMPTYQSTEHRSFTFTWDFFPRTWDDSESLKEMLNNLRKDSLPDKTSTSTEAGTIELLSFPNIFYIAYSNSNGSLTKFSKEGYVCNNIEVSYNGGGTWYQFSNGEPAQTSLSISLTERRRMTKELY